MDEEDIYSVSESQSIFKGMKKKESRPVYLQLKGSFLTAMAVNESENYNINNNPLLSKEQESNNNEENSEMTILKEEEDILTVAKELSDDLSSIAADTAKKEDSVENSEETAEVTQEEQEETKEETKEEAPAVEEEIETEEKQESKEEISTEAKEESDVQVKDAESDNSEESVEKPELNQEQEVDKEVQSELNDKEEVAEQNNDELSDKIKLLEEENKNLKAALHRVLAERVVDAKIAAGIESAADRGALVADHATRTASSLADSLRDIAKMPVKKANTNVVPEITSEAENSKEETNVLSIEDISSEKKEEPNTAEQLFVDALMGRRSL
jgi:hypothetical protein